LHRTQGGDKESAPVSGETRLNAVGCRFTLSSLFWFNKEGSPMKKFVALSLVAVASLSLAACSKGAENTAAADANEAVADLNATADETMADLNAAVADTTNAADAMLDNASNAVDAAADNASNAM
jgi:hypothetical protein